MVLGVEPDVAVLRLEVRCHIERAEVDEHLRMVLHEPPAGSRPVALAPVVEPLDAHLAGKLINFVAPSVAPVDGAVGVLVVAVATDAHHDAIDVILLL